MPTTLKKSFQFFAIGILIGIASLVLEIVEEIVIEENQDFELISFLKEFLEDKNLILLLIFIAASPISIYLSFKSYGGIVDKLTYLVLVVTGFGWFGILLWLIELAMGSGV